ncbi:terminase family protein [Lentisphaerota bacterium WC36G]|nr:terminase family protein [Lentisphaerae bacterium WC36]
MSIGKTTIKNSQGKTIDLGFKPHKFQLHALKNITRFFVLVCHRRWGKTVLAIMKLNDAALKCAKNNPKFGYVAPFRNQAKEIAWGYLKDLASKMPGVKINESELSIHYSHNNAIIRLYGADNPDAIRGAYLDGCVLDEVADMKSSMWEEIIRPMLSDRKGWCLFLGTPKGINLFYKLFLKAKSGVKNWGYGYYPVTKTINDLPQLDEEELADARADMRPEKFAQEFLCDFQASNDNVVIPLSLINKSLEQFITEEDCSIMPKILGVDIATGQSSDYSMACIRQGNLVFPLIKLDGDNMSVANRIASLMNKHHFDAVFIDLGRGEGVISRLNQLNYNVIGIDFGSKPLAPKKYLNKRSEMYDLVASFLHKGGILPKGDAELIEELSTPTYEENEKNQMVIEPKKKIKERLGRSPDRADALALTFAVPVQSRHAQMSQFNHREEYASDEISVL